jgi:hypothetical protein
MPNSWKKRDSTLSIKKQRGGHAHQTTPLRYWGSDAWCRTRKGSRGKSLAASKGTNKGNTDTCSAAFLLYQELGGVF